MKGFYVFVVIALCGMNACKSPNEFCKGHWALNPSLDSALTYLNSDSDYVFLLVRDSSEISANLDSFLIHNPCFKDSIQQSFTQIVEYYLPPKTKKKSLGRKIVDFKNEHKLELPFALIIGRNDTVFSYSSLLNDVSTHQSIDSSFRYLLSEIKNPSLRNDISFLSGESASKYRPSYYSWTQEVKAYVELDVEHNKLLVQVHNPNKVRIIANGTHQRDYLTPIYLIWENDSISIPEVQWKSEVYSFKDAFLNKGYSAYTDSVILGEIQLSPGSPLNIQYYSGILSYSAYLPKRKSSLNSIQTELIFKKKDSLETGINLKEI